MRAAARRRVANANGSQNATVPQHANLLRAAAPSSALSPTPYDGGHRGATPDQSGMMNFWPGKMRSGLSMSLALAIFFQLTPYFSPISESVSPFLTV